MTLFTAGKILFLCSTLVRTVLSSLYGVVSIEKKTCAPKERKRLTFNLLQDF